MHPFVVFLLAFFVPSYSQFYTNFDPHGEEFTQELYGHAPITSSVFTGPGVAFVGDRILITNCDGNETLQEVPINGHLGGQTDENGRRFSRLGMAVYPKDPTKIYFATHHPNGSTTLLNAIAVLDTITNEVTIFSNNSFLWVHGMAFNPEGDLLFTTMDHQNLVKIFEVPSASELELPQAIAYHNCSDSLFVANRFGELWRFNGTTTFNNTELFASGARRAGMGAVGPDGCFYLTYSEGFRYPNGVFDDSHQSSLVKICNNTCGFGVPLDVPATTATTEITGTTATTGTGLTDSTNQESTTDSQTNESDPSISEESIESTDEISQANYLKAYTSIFGIFATTVMVL